MKVKKTGEGLKEKKQVYALLYSCINVGIKGAMCSHLAWYTACMGKRTVQYQCIFDCS